MAKKQGWEKGLGKYAQPVKLTEGKPLEDAKKGKEITEVWTNNDLGAVRGTREGSSLMGILCIALDKLASGELEKDNEWLELKWEDALRRKLAANPANCVLPDNLWAEH